MTKEECQRSRRESESESDDYDTVYIDSVTEMKTDRNTEMKTIISNEILKRVSKQIKCF